MAKKGKNKAESFAGVLSMLSAEKLFQDTERLGRSPEEILGLFSEQNYLHQCPDYALQITPIASYLLPLWVVDGEIDEDLRENLLLSCSSVPKEELVRELRNFVLNTFVDFQEDSEDLLPSQLWGVFWLMEHFELTSCLDVVLEIMRQDVCYLDAYFDYGFEEVLSTIVYQLGRNKLDILLGFMQEPDILSLGKYRVVEAVANIVIEDASKRLEVMNWFCKVLNFYYEELSAGNDRHSMTVDWISKCLLNIRGVEALPILEKIYKHFDIPSFEAPNFNILKKDMANSELVGLNFNTMKEFLLKYAEEFVDDDEWMDDECIDDSAAFYLDDEIAKKLRLKIVLEESEPLIWRTLEIPSNIRLVTFARIVGKVMGWEGYHLHQFKKGKSCYMSREDINDGLLSGSEVIVSNSLSLGELLNRKGASIKYEYDFGDGWMHKISVESREDYKETETHLVLLLDGANACPPEDCGGIYGYYSMLEVLKKRPRSKEAREYKEWLGRKFDPAFFDIEKVKEELVYFWE